jgi:hypothetical protein
MEAIYKWKDWFSQQRHSCRCEVLGRGKTGTTAVIILKEYGPYGRPPGTKMTVKLSSIGLKPERQLKQEVLNWHNYTD